jgi:hypothetical protein
MYGIYVYWCTADKGFTALLSHPNESFVTFVCANEREHGEKRIKVMQCFIRQKLRRVFDCPVIEHN